jgi:uncharacterized membrane-anchored protein YhcB (DUF1043 family)
MRRLGWQAWIAALALLVIGAVLGITVDRFHVRSGDHQSSLLDEVQRDPMAVMERELNLRPEQRGPIEAIFQRHQRVMDSVWGEANSRLRSTIDSVVSEIAAQLDSSQARRFRALVDEIHSSPGAFHGRRH